MNEEVKVKPFWQSVSFWLTVVTCVGIVLDQLVLDGLLPAEGWVAIVLSIIGLVTKRGLTENAAMKASAHLKTSKEDN